jgi:hypothetical protein
MLHGKEGRCFVGSHRSRSKEPALRGRKKDQKNVKTSVALEAKALGGDGVEVPAAVVAVAVTLRKMAKLSEDSIIAIEHAIRPLRGLTKCCKVCSGPTPEECVVAASGLAALLVCLRTFFYSESPPPASGRNTTTMRSERFFTKLEQTHARK